MLEFLSSIFHSPLTFIKDTFSSFFTFYKRVIRISEVTDFFLKRNSAWNSSSPVFLWWAMYSKLRNWCVTIYKPWRVLPYLEPGSCLCPQPDWRASLWPAYRFLSGVWPALGSGIPHLFLGIQTVCCIHTIKGFGIANKETDVFLNAIVFWWSRTDVGNLNFWVPLCFSKPLEHLEISLFMILPSLAE